MEELKKKFIEAIDSIDFAKLNLCELQTVASISETVDKMAKKDSTEVLADSLKATCFKSATAEKPKTIAEMRKEK